MIWKSGLGLTCALGAFGVGHMLTPSAPAAPPAAVPTPAQAAAMHDDGNDGAFHLEATAREGAVDVVIINEKAKRGWFTYAIEVVDDRGVAVAPVRRARAFAVDARSAAPGLEHALPETLRDGYYQVRATVAFAAGSDAGTKVASAYVRVEGGRAIELPVDEWYRSSSVTLATRLEEVRR